jgi:very-short-patch-repair endonuclease
LEGLFIKDKKMGLFSEKWEKDKKRSQLIESMGYGFFVIWEKEIKSDKASAMELIRNEIRKRIDV